MKNLSRVVLTIVALFGLTVRSHAYIYVDDLWPTGNRSTQNPPASTAWFNSSSGQMTAYPGMLSVTNKTDNSSSEWTTYITAAGTPLTLAVGDTMTVSLTFKINGIGSSSTSKNLRFGLYNSSGGARVTSDGNNVNGTSYTGYGMFQAVQANNWTSGSGLQWLQRTNIAQTGLQGTTSTLASWGSGGTVNSVDSISFTNGGTYTLTLTVNHFADTTNILTAAYTGGGMTNSWTVTNYSATLPSGFYPIVTNFDTLSIRPSGDLASATNFVFTEFKVIGPTPLATSPVLFSQPVNFAVTEGGTAYFNVSAGGTAPLYYQWYYNTNTPVPNATNALLTLGNVASNANAGFYSVVVTNSASSLGTTSTLAQLFVSPAFAPGIITNDTWGDGLIAEPTTNLTWFTAGTNVNGSGISAVPGLMTLTPQTNSRTWLTYFTSNTAVHLNLGQKISATTIFTPSGMTDNTNNSFRVGLFNSLLPGVVPMTTDTSSGNANGANVRGYVVTMNFSSIFRYGSLSTPPFELDVRTNIPGANLMGTTADYATLATGGAFDGVPGFADGSTYTNVFSITRNANGSVGITNKVTGPAGFNVSYGASDILGTNVIDFNTFAMRAANMTETSTNIAFTLFQIDLSAPAAAPAPSPLKIQLSGSNAILTWTNPVFALQSASVVTGAYSKILGATSPYTNAAGGSQKYYRLIWP